jgi:hypothetical protein
MIKAATASQILGGSIISAVGRPTMKEGELDHQIYLARRTFDPSGEPGIPPSDELGYYIVQFKKTLTGEDRDRLRNQYKLSLNQYIPNLAFLERLDSQTVADLSSDPLHRAIAIYRSDYKISPEIGTSGPYSAERRNLNGLLIRVFLFSAVRETDIANVVEAIRSLRGPVPPKEQADAQVETTEKDNKESCEAEVPVIQFDPNEIRVIDDRELGGQVQLVLVLLSLELLPQIAKLDHVQWIEEAVEAHPDSAITVHCAGPNTVSGTIQSGNPQSTSVWNNHIHGCGQIIGIIDSTLVDKTHCMFRDCVPVGAAHRKLIGFRLFSDLHDNRHGTAVAAIAVGDEFGNSGQNANRGIAWAAKLSYDDQKRIRHQGKTLLEVLYDASNDNVMIHSNSWHDPTKAYNKTAVDADTFVWQNEEHFVCGSAGNSSSNEVLGPPGTAKNVLCVSASLGYPEQLKHGDGLTGPTPDHRRKPEICAPGVGIIAARSGSGCGCDPLPHCATSFATPVIAGAAALVRQYYLEGFHHGGVQDPSKSLRPSGALVKATLLNSTVPMEDESKYPNNLTGWGLVKLDNTLFFAGSPRRLFVADVFNADGLDTGQSRAYQITIESNAQPLKITLVWSDPPAGFMVDPAMVNDLNLLVTSPNGESIFLGNVRIEEGFSQPVPPNTPADSDNNVEMVIVKEPTPGLWTITIECAAANGGSQGYALVATGSLTQ